MTILLSFDRLQQCSRKRTSITVLYCRARDYYHCFTLYVPIEFTMVTFFTCVHCGGVHRNRWYRLITFRRIPINKRHPKFEKGRLASALLFNNDTTRKNGAYYLMMNIVRYAQNPLFHSSITSLNQSPSQDLWLISHNKFPAMPNRFTQPNEISFQSDLLKELKAFTKNYIVL